MNRILALVFILMFIVAPAVVAADNPDYLQDTSREVDGIEDLDITFYTTGESNLPREGAATFCDPDCGLDEVAPYVDPRNGVHNSGVIITVRHDRLLGFTIPAGHTAQLFNWGTIREVPLSDVEQKFDIAMYHTAIIFLGEMPEVVRTLPYAGERMDNCRSSEHCDIDMVLSGVGVGNSSDPDDRGLVTSEACSTYELEYNQLALFEPMSGEWGLLPGPMTLHNKCGDVWIFEETIPA